MQNTSYSTKKQINIDLSRHTEGKDNDFMKDSTLKYLKISRNIPKYPREKLWEIIKQALWQLFFRNRRRPMTSISVQSKATSIVNGEPIPSGDKLRSGLLFRVPGSPDKDIHPFWGVGLIQDRI